MPASTRFTPSASSSRGSPTRYLALLTPQPLLHWFPSCVKLSSCLIMTRNQGGFEAEELEGPKSIIGYPNGLIVRVSNVCSGLGSESKCRMISDVASPPLSVQRDIIYGIKGLAMGTVHQYPKEKVTPLFVSMAPIHTLELPNNYCCNGLCADDMFVATCADPAYLWLVRSR